MPHRMVTQLEDDCQSLAAAASEHNPLISESVTELWRSDIPKGQKVINLFQLQSCLAADLIHRRDRLVGDDDAVVTRLTLSRVEESERDASGEELREKLFQARSTFEGVYGAGSSFKIFEEAPVIPTKPLELRRLALRVVGNLTSPEFRLPPVREEGVTLDPIKLARGIQKPLDKMDKALAALAQKRRHYDQTLQQKGSSMAGTRATVGRTARFLEALYDLAGYDVLSARVRPSSHKAARDAAEVRAAEEAARDAEAGDGAGAGADTDATVEAEEAVDETIEEAA